MKKIISLLLLIVLLLSVFQSVVLGANEIEYANVKKGEAIETGVEYREGTNENWRQVESNYIYYKGPKGEFPAYNVSPGKKGVNEIGNYQVNINKLLLDAEREAINFTCLWRTIVNGYPYKRLDEMGVDTEMEAYFVTEQAIYCVMNSRNTKSYRAVTAQGEKIIKAIERLTQIGAHGGQNPEETIVRIEEKGEMIEKEEYYYQEYTVVSNIYMSQYEVKLQNGSQEGIFVANNQEQKQTTFRTNETFKIIIPKEQANKEIDLKITVNAKCQNYPIFYGDATVRDAQDYAIVYGKLGEVIQSVRFSMQLGTGQLRIEKVDEETNEPISNVTFELYSKELEEVIGTYITDQEGKIYVENLKVGEYELREIATKEGYEIGENMNISIQEGKTIEITVKSKKTPSNIEEEPPTTEENPPIEDEEPPTVDKEPTDKEPDIPNKKPTIPEKQETNSSTASKKPTNVAKEEVKKLPKTGF